MEKNKPFEHNKFKYTEVGIEYPDDIKIPKHLYKYYSFSKYSVEALVNNYLYFSHPSQLNDIIDSTDLLLDFENCSIENYNGLYEYRIGTFGFDRGKKPSFEEAKKNNFIDLRSFIYFFGFFNKGLLSLTSCSINKLMMAHYTAETGFILKFERDLLLNSLDDENEINRIQLFPMNYSKTIKPINFFKESKKTIENVNGKNIHSLDYKIPFLYISSLKDIVWKYEDEWRIIIEKDKMGHIAPPLDFREVPKQNIINGRKIKYNNNCLNKIILAPMFFNNSSFKAEIKKVNNNKISFSFSLNIENFKEKKVLDSFREFLNKICSHEYIGKIFIQDIDFSNLQFERKCVEMLDIEFLNDIVSFTTRNG